MYGHVIATCNMTGKLPGTCMDMHICSHGIEMKFVFGLLPLLVILILKERVGYIKMINFLADIRSSTFSLA